MNQNVLDLLTCNCHCKIKTPLIFRTQNIFISAKAAFIETKLRKRLILSLVTLRCNSATKYRL